MLLVTMVTELMHEEYFAIRYFNPQLLRKKKQNLTLKKKAIFKLFIESFCKKMFVVYTNISFSKIIVNFIKLHRNVSKALWLGLSDNDTMLPALLFR